MRPTIDQQIAWIKNQACGWHPDENQNAVLETLKAVGPLLEAAVSAKEELYEARSDADDCATRMGFTEAIDKLDAAIAKMNATAPLTGQTEGDTNV